MANLISGAALANAVRELLDAVLEAKVRIPEIKDHMKRLKCALESLSPLIEEAIRLDMVLTDRQREDMNGLCCQLREGKELVLKCSKLCCFNLRKKHEYAKGLTELETEILRFSQANSQTDTWVDFKKLLSLKGLDEKLDVLGGKRGMVVDLSDSTNGPPRLPEKVFGLEGPLRELQTELFRKDVSVVGVCGLPGCGKTTLASMLCRDKIVRATFKERIFFFTVSNSPDVLGILQRMWRQLVKAKDMPRFFNEEDAVKQLSDNMSYTELQPVLVVLDDVWSESVLEKLIFRIPNLKTVITSRTKFELLDSTYSLRTLKESDSMDLFCHSAFVQDNAFGDTYKEFAYQIVRGCKGLPLALEVIGHSLRHKPLTIWHSTAEMLRQGDRVFDDHKDLLNCLSTTLTSLDDQLRKCFADLGCFPEDEKIPAASLIDMWIELYGLSEHEAYVALLKLSARYLVTLVERTRNDAVEDGIFNDLFVFQHDLLRDLAMYSAKGNHVNQNARLLMNQREDVLPNSWKERTDQPFLAQVVSMHTGEMNSSSWFDMKLPNTEVMILNFMSETYYLPPFLENMENLKVLIVANHSLSPADLTGLNIADMFPELTELEIDYCSNLVRLPPGLCEIIKLQKLSLSKCPDLIELPERIGNLSNLEVLSLHACTSLEDLPNSLCKLKSLRFFDVSDCATISSFPDEFGDLTGLRKINMRWCLQVTELPVSVKQMEGLRVVVCDEDTAGLWEPFKCMLTDMELHVVKEEVNLNFLT
ncbi:putative disease resistance protein [Nymphaea thermarum]|nr:putative disease resistance protein [Nymphaea thermarum]